MVQKDFKGLPRRTASDKLLHDRALNVSSDPRYDRYQRDDRYQRYQLASMVYKIFHTKPRVTNTHTGAGNISENQQLADLLFKLITRKYRRHKAYSSY